MCVYVLYMYIHAYICIDTMVHSQVILHRLRDGCKDTDPQHPFREFMEPEASNTGSLDPLGPKHLSPEMVLGSLQQGP